ncbi:MAG: hypothetical protein FWB73_01845 [Treponema sp.]|nr:hypothetical protein [Treponema sp.]
MQRRIFISDTDNGPVVYFDTGLEPRSFARTKMAQSLIEPGFVVHSDGTHKPWKPSGVNDMEGFMRVWGPLFNGKRLDLLLDEINPDTDCSQSKQEALNAVVLWIKAKLFLGETKSVINPGASFVGDNDVFFAPEHISTRCLFIEQTGDNVSQQDRYNCPDLIDINATAFCAGVMLYKILTGSHPYPTEEIYQNMREGVYLPAYLAAPDMDEKISSLIQDALHLPVAKKQPSKNGTVILSEILNLLCNKTKVVDVSSLYTTLPAEKNARLLKQKKWYLFRQASAKSIKNIVIRNRKIFIGMGIALLIFLFLFINTVKPDPNRPRTEGMTSDSVVTAYYSAFSLLDHFFMEACVLGADRSDINAAVSLFAINRARQAYDSSLVPVIISAKTWQEHGGALPAPNVFGVTDFSLEHLSGNENDVIITYRADYLLWAPDEEARNRSDTLTLKRDRFKNWRITDILRIEQ